MRIVSLCLPSLGVILGLVLAALAPGCNITGYSIRAPYDTKIKTVYVPVFKSITFRRDINIMLTELVIKEIERRTPYKVRPRTPRRPTRRSTGTVNFSDKNIIVENPFNLPRQLTSTMIVIATWTDNKAEEKKAPQPAVISETFNFYPEDRRVGPGRLLPDCERLATQIVNMMEEPW